MSREIKDADFTKIVSSPDYRAPYSVPSGVHDELKSLPRRERRQFKKAFTQRRDERWAIDKYRRMQGRDYVDTTGATVIGSVGGGPLLNPLPETLDIDDLTPMELQVLIDLNFLNYGVMTEEQIEKHKTEIATTKPSSKEKSRVAKHILNELIYASESEKQSDAKLTYEREKVAWRTNLVSGRMAQQAFRAINTPESV